MDETDSQTTTVTHTMVVDVQKLKPVACQYSSWFKHPQSNDDIWWRVQCEMYGDLSDMEQYFRVEINGKQTTDPSFPDAFPSKPNRFFLCSAVARICQVSYDGQKKTFDITYAGQRGSVNTSITLYPVIGGGERTLLPNLRHATISVWITQLQDRSLEEYLSQCVHQEVALAPAISPATHTLWESRKFADVTLSVEDGHELPAHKLILVASSPFFEAMFDHDMRESRQNRVEIKDVSAEVMTEALRFMYSGVADTSKPDLAKALLTVSERYLLHGLRPICEQALVGHVLRDKSPRTSDSTCAMINTLVSTSRLELARDLLPLSDLYPLPRLKAACELTLMSNMANRELDFVQMADERSAPALRKVVLARLASLPAAYHVYDHKDWRARLAVDSDLVRELLLAKLGVNQAAGMLKKDR